MPHCKEGKRSIVLQIVGNGSNFRAKSFPCNVNTGCLFARGGAACGNAHFFFHTKNKYLSNAEQYKLEKSHRKCPWIRQCCQNVIAAKNIIYICFWQTLTEIWSVKDPIILGLSQTAHPMIGGGGKIACYLLLNIRCWKLIKNWMWASKMARYLCFRTHPSVPVWAEIWRRLEVAVICW